MYINDDSLKRNSKKNRISKDLLCLFELSSNLTFYQMLKINNYFNKMIFVIFYWIIETVFVTIHLADRFL